METSFDFEPVGAVASEATNTSSIEKKLDRIIEELTAIKENTKSAEKVEQIVEAIPENDEILKEVNSPVVPEEITSEMPIEEEHTEVVSEENPTPVVEDEKIEAPVEEQIETPIEDVKTAEEETFTPVNVSNIDMDAVPNEQNITSMEDLLASIPQETAKEPEVLEEIKDIEVAPVEQPIVPPVPSEVQADPVIVPEPVPAPVVEPIPVPQPIVEPTPTEVSPVVDPAKAEALLVDDEPTMEFKPDVLVGENNTPIPVVETPVVNKNYTVVTNLYTGMTDVKTGNEPHRVIPMPSNEVLLAKKDAKTLINKAA